MDAVTPLPRTHLSLEKYRQLLGFNPAFFNQAAGINIFRQINQCDDIFYQFYWQNESNVSREEIANAILEAESNIEAVLGYPIAPTWLNEVYDYPRHHRRDVIEYGMTDIRGFDKAVQLKNARFIQGGQRATTLVTSGAAVTRTDTDGDGYKEMATITTPTSLTDACEIKCYFAGESANPDWEVRSPRSVTISGGNVTFKYFSWQLLDPELQQQFTIPNTDGQSNPIDIEDDASYVSTVDVYREYNDFTAVSAQLLWERTRLLTLGLMPIGFCCSSCGGAGCPSCTFIAQDGCIHVRDAAGQFVVPIPATYDATNAQWQLDTPTVCRDPDLVKVWYYAGEQSQQFKAGRTCEPLSNDIAQAIAWLATARVNRPFCSCNNSQAFSQSPDNLQRAVNFTGSRELGSYAVSQLDLENPFGVRVGEILAWRKIGRLTSSAMIGVAV